MDRKEERREREGRKEEGREGKGGEGKGVCVVWGGGGGVWGIALRVATMDGWMDSRGRRSRAVRVFPPRRLRLDLNSPARDRGEARRLQRREEQRSIAAPRRQLARPQARGRDADAFCELAAAGFADALVVARKPHRAWEDGRQVARRSRWGGSAGEGFEEGTCAVLCYLGVGRGLSQLIRL